MSENKEISVSNLGDAIRDKVRKTLFDALPEEAITNLIQSEFKNFFEERVVYDSYNRRTDKKNKSLFAELVEDEITKQMKPFVIEFIKSALPKFMYGNNDEPIAADQSEKGKEIFDRLMKQLAPAALDGIINSIIYKVSQNLRSSIY